MKRLALTTLAIYVGCDQVYLDCRLWLPAWGSAFENGYVWGEVVILGVLAALVFGTIVWMGYEALSYVFE